MPKLATPLTATGCGGAKPQTKSYKLSDGGGLYLLVQPSGSKLWRMDYRIGGKANTYAVGEYPQTSLKAARDARDAARSQIAKGIHPAHARQRDKLERDMRNANTLAAVTAEWMERGRTSWAPGHLKQMERITRRDLLPVLGSLPLADIEALHLIPVLQRVERRGAPQVARLLRSVMSGIFRYGIATGRAKYDPASALRGTLKPHRVTHHPDMPATELRAFAERLAKYQGTPATVAALRLIHLLFVRKTELRAAEWTEFDLERAEWIIPASRMKMRARHIVPLPAQAVTILRDLAKVTGKRRYLFPNTRRPDSFMAAQTLNMAMTRLGYKGQYTVHGFRHTASTLLNGMGFPRDVIERQLAHKERDTVRGSYNHADYLPQRRQMMQSWADYLDRQAVGDTKVVPLRAA